MRYLLNNSILNLIAFNCIPNSIFSVEQKNHLLHYYEGNCNEILNSKLKDLYSIVRKRNSIAYSFETCFQEAEILYKKYKHSIVCVLDNDYIFTPYFSNCTSYRLLPPFLLYFQGNKQLLRNQKKISIVGTRNPYTMSEQFTDYIIPSINKTTVSGFAKGIDRQVHITSLKNNIPTIAVWGNGFNILYPKENLALYKAFINSENSLIISEYPPNTLPKREFFPLRNRIIALLGDYCILIQASIPSGALITCNYAKKYNKDVFVFYPSNLKGFEGNARIEKDNNGIKLYGVKNSKLLIKQASIMFDNKEIKFSKEYLKYNMQNLQEIIVRISKLPKENFLIELDKFIGNFVFNNPRCTVTSILKATSTIDDSEIFASLTRLIYVKKIWMDSSDFYYPVYQ